MKFLKWVMVLLGLAALASLIYFLPTLFWRWNTVMGYAQANRSVGIENPRKFVWYSLAAALVGGLLLGIGIGMPLRTRHSIRRDARAEFAPTTATTNATLSPADQRSVTDTVER